MAIKIVPTKKAEGKELLKIQKAAFYSDLIKYKDYKTNPADESLDSFFFRLQNSLNYSIYIDGKLAGAICVVKLTQTHYYLDRIYLGTEFQNKGYGAKVLKLLEEQSPQAKKWSLYTPRDNRRNRHFYEKLGYKKIGVQKVNEYLTLIYYEKRF